MRTDLGDVVEWLAASSTLCLSGVAVWTLMVRRTMYMPVKVTKQLF